MDRSPMRSRGRPPGGAGASAEPEAAVVDEAHDGEHRNLVLDGAALDEARRRLRDAKEWDLTPRQLCDLELLLNGAFSPLEGFMTVAEYEGVLRAMRLPSRVLWPVPVTLDVSEDFAAGLRPGDAIMLRDAEGLPVTLMEAGDTWRPENDEEARAVHGAGDDARPGVSHVLHRTHPVYVGGRVRGFGSVPHYDHRALRHSFAGWRVVASQTRNRLHRAHVELTRQTARGRGEASPPSGRGAPSTARRRPRPPQRMCHPCAYRRKLAEPSIRKNGPVQFASALPPIGLCTALEPVIPREVVATGALVFAAP